MIAQLIAQNAAVMPTKVAYGSLNENFVIHQGIFFDAWQVTASPAICEVGAYLVFRSLYEVHLTSFGEASITTRDQGRYRGGLPAMLLSFSGADPRSSEVAHLIKYKLQSSFAQRMALPEISWHFSIEETEAGKVIAVLFGHTDALEAVYSSGHRMRPA